MTYRKYLIRILIIVPILYSCNGRERLNYRSLIGEYYNGTDAENFNHLILRRDCTYLGVQSIKWGDMMIYYRGKWEIKDGLIILYRGRDISDDLIVEEVEDAKSDTLIVNVGEDVFKVFPRMRLSIDSDTVDLLPTANRFEIVKKKYLDITHPAIKSDSYQYFPVTLNLRAGNTYATVGYIFTNRKLSISLANNFDPVTKTDSILCKYEKKKSILFSIDETYEIERNNLKKGTN